MFSKIFQSFEENHLKDFTKSREKYNTPVVILRYMYIKLGKYKDLKIIVFTDGAHGNLVDGGSQGSYFVFLVGENGKCALISWQAKRICRVAKRSLAAETLSMSDGIDGTVFVNALLSEIYFGNTRRLPIEFITDDQPLVDALKSSTYVSHKCLRIEIVKYMTENIQISKIRWIHESKKQILTKKGVSVNLLKAVLSECHLMDLC